ncbi:MAG: sulfite exporter TauE/SafE family protein [Thermoplasmata archaeon]|nr:sulfite exporter TauE/SafE family protein [Thermoplasmata archaeon]
MALPLLETLLALAVAAFLAGFAGSVLGVGGGIFLIPFMTLALQLDIKVSIATSLVGVIATSSGSASVYVRDHLTNLRLAMFLEVATTIGAIGGAVVAILVPASYLYVIFGVVVLYGAATMVRVRETAKERAYRGGEESPLSKRLNLGTVYFDQEDQGVYRYRVEHPVAGFGVSAAAGVFSGLLGVGGGFIKVPAMNVLMKVPMKAAVATSNFMVGVTAAASAFIYYSEGLVNPALAAMVIIGVFSGTNLGTRLLLRSKAGTIRFVFAGLLAVLGIAMAARVFFPGIYP